MPGEPCSLPSDDRYLIDLRDLNAVNSVWPGAFCLLESGTCVIYDDMQIEITRRDSPRAAWQEAAAMARVRAEIRARKAARLIDFAAWAVEIGPAS